MKIIYKGKKEKVSLLLAVMLVASLCLSVIFVSHHVEHEHGDEDCQVCAILQIARTNFQNLNSGASLFFQAQNIHLFIFSFPAVSVFFALKTPVSEKIRLNN
ncbi:MAG: hypothetical protein II821_01025 [Treponema sp.]|nr:hypothetical protein [Treponema sp.]